MDKKELYQYVGSMQQMVYIRKVTCEEGRSTGLRMFDVKNECLQYQVMCDKCLDVAGFSYKGINMNFLSSRDFREEIITIPMVRKRFAVSWAACSLQQGWRISAHHIKMKPASIRCTEESVPHLQEKFPQARNGRKMDWCLRYQEL